MKRRVEVSVIKAVGKGIDVSEVIARVSCSKAQRKGAYEKGSAQVP